MYGGMSVNVSIPRTEIGFLCDHGHFCFFDDPTYDRGCAANRVAGIFVEADPGLDFHEPRYDYDADGDLIGGDSGYSEDDFAREIAVSRESFARRLEPVVL